MKLSDNVSTTRRLRISTAALLLLFKTQPSQLLRIIKHRLPDDAEIVCVRYDELKGEVVIGVSSRGFTDAGELDAPWFQLI